MGMADDGGEASGASIKGFVILESGNRSANYHNDKGDLRRIQVSKTHGSSRKGVFIADTNRKNVKLLSTLWVSIRIEIVIPSCLMRKKSSIAKSNDGSNRIESRAFGRASNSRQAFLETYDDSGGVHQATVFMESNHRATGCR